MRVTRSIGSSPATARRSGRLPHGGPAPARRRRIAASSTGELPHHHLRPARAGRSSPLGELADNSTASRARCRGAASLFRHRTVGGVRRLVGLDAGVELCESPIRHIAAPSSCAASFSAQSEIDWCPLRHPPGVSRGRGAPSPRRFRRRARYLLTAYYRRSPIPTGRPPAGGAQLDIYEGACSTLLRARTPSQAFGEDRMALAWRASRRILPPRDRRAGRRFYPLDRPHSRRFRRSCRAATNMVCPIGTADELARAWPEAAYAVVPDAGHFGDGAGNPRTARRGERAREAAELSRKRLRFRLARTRRLVRCWRPRRFWGLIDKNARDDAAGSTMADRGAGGWAILGRRGERAIDTVRTAMPKAVPAQATVTAPRAKGRRGRAATSPHSSRSASAFSTSAQQHRRPSLRRISLRPEAMILQTISRHGRHHERAFYGYGGFSRRHLPRHRWVLMPNARSGTRQRQMARISAHMPNSPGAEFALSLSMTARGSASLPPHLERRYRQENPGGGDGDRLLAALSIC